MKGPVVFFGMSTIDSTIASVKALFITRKYPPSTGGMERFAYDLSHALADKIDLRLVKWGGSRRALLLLVIPSLWLQSAWQLIKGGVNVIHVQDGILAPLAYSLALLFQKPYVVVIHGLDITYPNKLYQAVIPWAVRRASSVVCISQATAREAQERGVAAAKIQVISLAIKDELHGRFTRVELLQQLNLPTDTPLLLTVGRLVKRKGIAWFIDSVLPGLVERYPSLVYVVVGEGPERLPIEAAISRGGLAEHVRLLGQAEDSLYKAAYNGADIFVMPNIHVPGDMEGFGLVLLEASLCALPVVAADIEGIKDAVTDGKNGILVPVKDVTAFQDEISHFLANKLQAAQFGKQSRRFTLENYQWDKLADRYIAEYQRLVRP